MVSYSALRRSLLIAAMIAVPAHHLLIDTTLSADELKAAIPADAKHVHFGGGQTETMVTLPPGRHTLQLELGDWSHIPFNPPIHSAVITITVK